MKNALILHGAGNNSQGNWFPWLKKELELKGYQTWVPDLPNSDVPDLETWLSLIFANKNFVFNDETIIFGHSAGSTCILHLLDRLIPGTKIKKAILVAGVMELGTIPEYYPYKRSMVEATFDWDKIRESASEFYFIHSDNDKYQCGKEQGEIMQSHLGGKLIIKSGQGHFNLEVSPEYAKFPYLLTLL